MRGAVYCAFLVAVLLLPTTAGAASEGSFLLEGPLFAPPGSSGTGRPLALYSPLEAGSSLSLHVPWAMVSVVERSDVWLEAGGVDLLSVTRTTENDSFPLTNLTLHLTRVGEGGVGLYPGPSSELRFSSLHALEYERRDASVVGDVEGAPSEDPWWPWYYVEVEAPHLLLSASASLAHAGKGALKVYGPDVVLRADENETHQWTGEANPSPGLVTRRWLYIQFDESRLEIAAASPATFALADARPSWDGPAMLARAVGSLHTPGGEYLVEDPAPVQLDGAFSGRLVPLPAQKGSQQMLLDLGGDHRDGSTVSALAVYHPAPQAVAAGLPWLWLPLALGLVAAGGAAGAYAAHQRLRRISPRSLGFSADDCLGFALQHAEDAQWGQALEWAQRGRRLAPRSARAWQLEGWTLVNLGCYDEAIAAYQAAFRIAPDGPGAYEVARVMVQADRSAAEAEQWLTRALRLDTALVDELLDDHAFHELGQRPAVARIVDEALARAWDPDAVSR